MTLTQLRCLVAIADSGLNITQAAGLGAGLLAEMANGMGEDHDLRILDAPAELPECITWAVLPRGRMLRHYVLSLLHGLAPQLDWRDLRRVLEGNQAPHGPQPPTWKELSRWSMA